MGSWEATFSSYISGFYLVIFFLLESDGATLLDVQQQSSKFRAHFQQTPQKPTQKDFATAANAILQVRLKKNLENKYTDC